MGGTIRQLGPHTDTTDGGLNTDTDSSKCWRLRVLDPGAGGSGVGRACPGLADVPFLRSHGLSSVREVRQRETERGTLGSPPLGRTPVLLDQGHPHDLIEP